MKVSVIYSLDKMFQVLEVIQGNEEKAWIKVNENKRFYSENNIKSLEVASFKSFDEMNDWITEQVIESRY